MTQDIVHPIVIHTISRAPLLVGDVRAAVEQGIRRLPARYPGLRVREYSIQPDRVEMSLDLQRLDEDLARIVQSFKAEVKTLAVKSGFPDGNFWQWGFEER